MKKHHDKKRDQGRQRKRVFGDPVFIFLYNHFEVFARSWPRQDDLAALGLDRIKTAPVDELPPLSIKVRDVILKAAAVPRNINTPSPEADTLVECIKAAPDFTIGILLHLRKKFKALSPAKLDLLLGRATGKLTDAQKMERARIRKLAIEYDSRRAKAFEGSGLDGFAKGKKAVRALVEKWNAAHPDAQVVLAGNKK